MIPRIVHRTLPAEPLPDVARIWQTVIDNTAGWELRTYQSPRDPADWPMTGHLFHLCRDKAEESDLVRLEALWVHGGVYLDSDMELCKNLDWVINKTCLTGWESADWYGMAFIAAEPKHPAIAALLDTFMTHVTSQGDRSTFPIVATNLWRERTDVEVLPQINLYPYHYGTRHEDAGKDWAAHPDVYAVHRWHGSWIKGWH
jgi:mannosyltransferase OCH1-like enzyme